MRLLVWTTIIALVVGAGFVIDGYMSWPSGSLLEIDSKQLRTAGLSLSIGSTLIGIGVLAGLLAMHARAVGIQTRAALAFQAAADGARRAEESRARQAHELRMGNQS